MSRDEIVSCDWCKRQILNWELRAEWMTMTPGRVDEWDVCRECDGAAHQLIHDLGRTATHE